MTIPNPHHASIQSHPLVILGVGYTGFRIYEQALETGWQVFATSRNPHLNLRTIPPEHRLSFDLTQPNTWASVPDPASLIWCFPAVPLDLIKQFFKTRSLQSSRLLILGSTSAYHYNQLPVTENTPLKLHLPRVQSEEFLRTQYGAVVIRLAGLYGPNRHVYDWIRKGKIQNSPKWVNLLHVEDAAAICLHALTHASKGSTYLASDGHPRTWNEICLTASTTWQISIPAFTATENQGKRVSNHKLRTELHFTFQYPDLFQALDHIEKNRPSP